MLLEACPNIEKDWKEHLEYWGEEKPGDYTNIAEFAHYVVDEHQNADFLSNFFSLVEKLLVEGTDKTKELITIGLIEDIQNISSHPLGWKVFEPYLGPESIKAWNYIISYWEGKNSLADVIRFEKKG